MSLPRRRPTELRAFQLPPSFAIEPDFSVIMPAVRMLRDAGLDSFALQDAFEAIPAHLFAQVAAFAGERHDMLSDSVIRLMLEVVGFEAFCRDIGFARASVIWRRFYAKG